MPTVELSGGRRASYSVMGDGAPILGVPGGPGFPAAYVAEFAEGLTDLLRWYLVDPPGTGESDAATNLGMGATAAFYAEAAAALGLDRYLAFGHSYSGALVPSMAAVYSDRIVGLVLAEAPVVGVEPDEVEGAPIRTAMNALIERHRDQPWFDEAYEANFGEPEGEPLEIMRVGTLLSFSEPSTELVDRLFTHVGDGFNDAMLAWFYEHEWPSMDLRPLLPLISCPTLSIVGEHDWVVPPQQAWLHSELMPLGTTVELRACGHWPPLEQPDAWRRAVRDWLANTGLAGDDHG